LLIFWVFSRKKAKAKSFGACYGAACISQTRDQKRFAISGQVAADWHEQMIPQGTMRPSVI